MINAPKENTQRLASAWTAGVGVLFLAIGLSGAVTPLAPRLPPLAEMKSPLPVEEPMMEIFAQEAGSAPPAAAAPETEAPPPDPASEPATEPEPQTEPDVQELPPPPEIPPPLTPPEMPEITPLQAPPRSRPVPKPATPPPPAKPKTASPPAAAPDATARARGGSPEAGGAPGGTPGGQGPRPGTQPGAGSGAGAGRMKGYFPQPPYPPAARRAGLEGTVVFSVVVDPSGRPQSAALKTSSGHAALDAPAREFLLRKWRWAPGNARRVTAPIKFYLE